MTKVKVQAGQDAVKQAGEAVEFVDAPPGLYIAELVECNAGFSKGDDDKEDKSRPRLECIYKPIGVGREGEPMPDGVRYGQVWDYVSFGEDSEWKRAQFGLAMGAKPDAQGNIDVSFETDKDKPGTIIGTKVILRVKRGKDLEGNYRAKCGGVFHIDSGEAAETSSAFADDAGNEESAPDNPFGDDSGAEEEDLYTEEYLIGLEMKDLGEAAKQFDLDPNDFLVKKRGKVDLDATQAAVVAAILEAQNGSEEAGDDDSPF